MTRLALGILALALSSSLAQAHEVWVERDGSGPARIYLGEPAEAMPQGGDPEFEKLKTPKILGASATGSTRKIGYIETAVPAGDVRVTDDNVFDPWGEDGKKQGVVYYARAGRATAASNMPLEIVPTAANADSFVVMRDGKPLPAAKVTVISPDKWSKAFVTDAQGRIAPPLRDRGRYILSTQHEEKGDLALRDAKVATLYHISTLTFVR